jgi:NAD(P)-dependent dehydrogenase (short-subunit alcohol dehydrogenase family)
MFDLTGKSPRDRASRDRQSHRGEAIRAGRFTSVRARRQREGDRRRDLRGGRRVEAITLDVTDDGAMARAPGETSKHGRLDVVVSNAGHHARPGRRCG